MNGCMGGSKCAPGLISARECGQPGGLWESIVHGRPMEKLISWNITGAGCLPTSPAWELIKNRHGSVILFRLTHWGAATGLHNFMYGAWTGRKNLLPCL